MGKKTSFEISLWERLKQEEIVSREAKRIETLENIVEQLRNYFADKNVERVLLFGSVLRERAFYDFSDIDIGVEGLKDDYFRTLCELEELVGRQVDLVEIEQSRFRKSKQANGIQIK